MAAVWSSMGLRWTLALRLLASWVISLLALSLFAISIGETGEGLWAVRLLSLASLPLITLGLGVTLVFPRAIRARPMLWGSGAVLLSTAAGFAVAEVAGLAFAGLVALPAFFLFVGSVKVWPGYASPTIDPGKVG